MRARATVAPMGTWDDGLYDNDSALDLLPELVHSVSLENSPAHLVAGIGLRLWLLGEDPGQYADELEEHAAWLNQFPQRVRDAIQAASHEDDDEGDQSGGTRGSRSEAVSAVLGSYCDGPRIDDLLTFEGADRVLEELAEQCRDYLNGFVDSPDQDLYELSGQLGPLGVLLELSEMSVTIPTEEIDEWEAMFDRANKSTTDEREFWDGYVLRVKRGFELLKKRTASRS